MLEGTTAKIRLPITIQLMQKIHDSLMASNNPEKLVIWTIATVTFFGFFRLGELLIAASAFDPSTCLINDSPGASKDV